MNRAFKLIRRCFSSSRGSLRSVRWRHVRFATTTDALESRALLSATADAFVAESLGDYGPFLVHQFDDSDADHVRQWSIEFGGDVFLQSAASDRTFLANEFIPVDPTSAFGLSGWAKAGDELGLRFDPANQQSFGVAAYDADYQLIGTLDTAALDHGSVPGDFTFSQYTAVFGFGATPHIPLPVGTAWIRPVVAANQHGSISNFITWRDVVVRQLPTDADADVMQQPIIDMSVDTPDSQTAGLTVSPYLHGARYAPAAELIRVDSDLKYTLSADIFDLPEYVRQPIGLQSYDHDGLLIHSVHVTRHHGATDTVLTQPVNPGDASIFVSDATGWSNEIGASAETRSLAWYGYTDGTGVAHADFTYTRNVAWDFDHGLWSPGSIAFDTAASAWRIDLLTAWNGGPIAVGTAIRNASGSDAIQPLTIPGRRKFHSAFQSSPARNDEIDWFNYSTDLGGGTWQDGQPVEMTFRPGTAFVQPVIRTLGQQATDIRFGLKRDMALEVEAQDATFHGARHTVLNRSVQFVEADQLVAVDPSIEYRISAQAATGLVLDGSHTPVEQHSIGFIAYDIDHQLIEPQHVTRHSTAVDTTLAAALNPGDTSIVLTNAAGWSNRGSSLTRALAWYGYQDNSGNVYPDFTYTRNVAFDPVNGLWDLGAVNGNVVTLRQTWAGPALSAGTAVRNAVGGQAFVPSVINHASVPNAWTNFEAMVTGEWENGVRDLNAFPPATAAIRLAARANEADAVLDEPLQLRDLGIRRTGTMAPAVTGDHRAVLDLDVLTNDLVSLPTTVIIGASAGTYGTTQVIADAGAQGQDIVRYTSAPWFVGTDSITYFIRDTSTGEQWSTTATVSVTGSDVISDAAIVATITAQGNDASVNTAAPVPTRVGPLQQPTYHSIEAGQTLQADGLPIPALTDFSEDADGDTLIVQLVSGTAHGVLNLNFDGTFEYTPSAGFVGDDSFDYTVFDGLHKERRTASIRVFTPNEALLAQRMKNIGVSLFNFHDTYNRFPYDPTKATQYDAGGMPLLSWRVHLLPFLGYQELFAQFHPDEPWDSVHNLSLLDQMPPVFTSPGDLPGGTETRFQLISDFDDLTGDYLLRLSSGRLEMGKIRDMVDGPSNIVLFTQTGADVAVPWTAPLDVDFDSADPFTALGTLPHDRMNLLMGDGTVVSLAQTSITSAEFQSLVTKSGRELLDAQTLQRRDAALTSDPSASVVDAAFRDSRQFRQLGLAFHNYHDFYFDLPVTDANSAYLDEDGFPLLSWRVHVLPFIDQAELYDQFHLDEPWNSPHNLSLMDQMPDIYRTLGDAADATATRIQVFAGPDAPFGEYRNTGTYRAPQFRDFTDGTSNTALLVQAGFDKSVPWTAPQDVAFDIANPLDGLGDLSDGKIRLVMTDGSYITVGSDIAPEIFSALVTHQGGELVDGQTLRARREQRTGVVDSQNARTRNRLKNIGLGFHNFHDSYNSFPLPSSWSLSHFDANGRPNLSWRVYLLPFLDQRPLFGQFHFDEPWDSPHNLSLLDQMPDVFRSNGDSWDSALTRFQVFSGPNAPFGRMSNGHEIGPRIRDYLDGTSNTFLAVEAGDSVAVPWTQPDDIEFDPTDLLGSLGLSKTDLLTVLLADGSVRDIGLDYSDAAVAAYVTMNGREVVTSVVGSVTPGITVTPNTLTGIQIIEGELGALDVILDKPGNVQIEVTLSQSGIVTTTTANLVFTTANWNVPQTISLEAVDDAVVDDTESLTVTLSVNTAVSDDEFDVLPDIVIPVHNVDNDGTVIDLVSTSFNAVNDHVLDGRTDVTFTLQNTGDVAAGTFQTHLVWSANSIVGDADDVIVNGSTETFSGLAAGAAISRTIAVQLDKAELFAHALVLDVPGGSVGTLSVSVSHLLLVVDVGDNVSETDEANNSGVGKLIDGDDITYFPWDTDGDGTATPLEALQTIQAIGTSDSVRDFDGNGVVSPLEALSAIQRIGYVRSNIVVGDTPPPAVLSGQADDAASGSDVLLEAALMPPMVSAPVVEEQPRERLTPSPVNTAPSSVATLFYASPNDDEARDLYPLIETTPELEMQFDAEHDGLIAAVDQSFQNARDWLNAI